MPFGQGGDVRLVASGLRGSSEELGCIGQRLATQLGQAHGQARHVAHREIRLAAADQPGVAPANKVVLASVAGIAGSEVHHHVASVRRRLEFQAEIHAGLRDAFRVHPSGWPPLPADVADRVEAPQRLLPPLHCIDDRLRVVIRCRPPARANVVQQKRTGRGVGAGEHRPKRTKILRVKSARARNRRDRLTALGQRVAIGERRGKIRLERNAAVPVDHVGLGFSRVVPVVTGVDANRHVLRIKILNLSHQPVGSVALGDMFREPDAVRQQHGVLPDLLSGVEKFAHERGRHHQRIAGIGEPLARRAVDGEFAGGVQRGNAGEVADGVVVLVVVEPPQHHAAGVARSRPGLLEQQAVHPLLQFRALVIAWLVGFLRRHLPAREHVVDLEPNLGVAPDVGDRLERVEINVRLGVLVRVALETELIEQRPDLRPVHRVQAGRLARQQTEKRSQQNNWQAAQALENKRHDKPSWGCGYPSPNPGVRQGM